MTGPLHPPGDTPRATAASHALSATPAASPAAPAAANGSRLPHGLRGAAPLLALLALAVLVGLAGALGYRYTYDTALARQAERGQVQLRLYTQALESELAHYDYVPGLLSLDERIAALLLRPDDATRTDRKSVV